MVVTIETLNPEIRNALDHFENLWRSREEYFEWCELIDPICFNKYRAMRGATISADKNLYENIVLSDDTIQKSHEYIRQFKVPNIDNLVPFARLCGCLKTYQNKFFYVDNDTLDVYYWTNMFSSTDDVYNRKPDIFERICTLNEFGTRINELLTLYNDHSMTIFVGDGDIPKDLPIIIGWNEDTPLYPKQLNTYPSDIGGGKRIVYAPPGVLKTIISEYNSNEYDEGLTWALGNTHSTKIFKAICDITGQDYSDLIHEFQADKYDHLLFPVIYKICNGNILLNIYSTNVLLIFDIGVPTRLFVMLSGNYSYDKCTIWIVKDGKTQLISESYIPDDATSGTSDFDEKDDDSEDCYCESHSPYFGSVWGVMPRVFTEGYKPSTPSGYGPYHRGVVHKLNPTYSKVYHSSQKPLNIVDGFLTLNGPLYVSPYKSISSIFALRVNWESPELDRVPNREFMVNIGYKEWAIKDDSLVKNITEYIEYCDDKHGFEPFTVEKSGYVYEILVDDEVRDHIFASDKMIMNGREVCIDYLEKVKVNEVIPIKGNVTFESRKCPMQSLCDERIRKLKEKGMISVNESYVPLSEFDHYFQESKMSSKTRNNLNDSDFALVYTESTGKKIRKYPINDEAHVKAAARMFPKGVPNKYRKEVAGKILRRAHKFGIDTSGWKSLNEANDKD